MPRRSARKRRAADTAAAAGSAASKGKRKSAPVRDQTSPLASLLTADALGRSLAFLDVPSLVRSEMAAKFVQAAAGGVWAELEKKIGDDEKADGDTARDRVVRSCPQYRRHILAEYAEKVERMKPANTETVLRGLGHKLGENLDFYVRFAEVERSDSQFIEYEGSERKGTTKFLAGGVFEPTKALDRKFGTGTGIAFGLSELDLNKWWSMIRLFRGVGFLNRYESAFEHNIANNDLREAMKNVTSTVVAINRKTLALSIVMASESHFCIDGRYRDDQRPFNIPNHVDHTRGAMCLRSWKYSDLDDADLDEMHVPYKNYRFSNFLFFNSRFSFLIRE